MADATTSDVGAAAITSRVYRPMLEYDEYPVEVTRPLPVPATRSA